MSGSSSDGVTKIKEELVYEVLIIKEEIKEENEEVKEEEQDALQDVTSAGNTDISYTSEPCTFTDNNLLY